mgnify:CR=1 FL=1
MRYTLVIHKDPGSSYGVTVPDLPGCFSAGDTLEEAMTQAREAIIFHLEGLAEDGTVPPPPRPVDEHLTNPDFADAKWAFVEVPDQELPGRAVRLNITLNERVLARIDAAARAMGETRSGLLQRGASELLDRRAGLTPPGGRRPRAASGRTKRSGGRDARRR